MLLVQVGSFDCFGLAKDSLFGQEKTIGILLDRIEILGATWGDVRAIEAFLELGSVIGLNSSMILISCQSVTPISISSR